MIRELLSSALRPWPILSLRLRGARGEMLRELKIRLPGRYVVQELNVNLRIERDFFGTKPGLKIHWNFRSLFVSFGSQLNFSKASLPIWKPYLGENLIPSFELKYDETSSYELRNQCGQRLEFLFEYVPLVSLARNSFREHFWVFSGFFPVLILCLLGLIPAQRSSRQETLDLSKTQVRLENQHMTKSGVSTTHSKFQNQIRSWNSGRKLPSASAFKKSYEELLRVKETNTQDAGRESADSVRAAWADDLETENFEMSDLNISAQEIQKNLQPYFADLKDCYDDVLIRDSSFQGSPRLILRIDISGKISEIQIQEMDRARASSVQMLKQCFSGVFSKLRIPKPNQEFLVSRRMYLNVGSTSLQ